MLNSYFLHPFFNSNYRNNVSLKIAAIFYCTETLGVSGHSLGIYNKLQYISTDEIAIVIIDRRIPISLIRMTICFDITDNNEYFFGYAKEKSDKALECFTAFIGVICTHCHHISFAKMTKTILISPSILLKLILH